MDEDGNLWNFSSTEDSLMNATTKLPYIYAIGCNGCGELKNLKCSGPVEYEPSKFLR